MADEYIRKADAIKQCGFGMTSLHIADNLRKMRPADVVQVVHSQWKYKCGEIQCPECGNRIHRIDLSGCLNFCPNCGAKMDGKKEE